VTAVSAGSATITYTTNDGDFTDTYVLTITAAPVPVTGVSVSPASGTLIVGATQQLTRTISPVNATDQTGVWESSNTARATVNQSGLVTAVSAGSATITYTTNDGAFTDTYVVTVTQPITGVTVTPSSGTLVAGNTQQLTRTISPAN